LGDEIDVGPADDSAAATVNDRAEQLAAAVIEQPDAIGRHALKSGDGTGAEDVILVAVVAGFHRPAAGHPEPDTHRTEQQTHGQPDQPAHIFHDLLLS